VLRVNTDYWSNKVLGQYRWTLKMSDVKMTDMKMIDQMTGHENAGHEIA